MAEWDGLDAWLKDLEADVARMVEDPPEPARIRQLGDRRRLRRAVAAILIAVAILVSGGVGVYAVTSQPQRHTPSPVGDPTSTPTTPTQEPSEEASGIGRRIPTTSGPGGGGRQVPPTYPTRGRFSPDPTPESPTPTETPTPSPTDAAEEPQSPEPTSTSTEPEPPPTSQPSNGGGDGGGGDGGGDGGGGAPPQTAPPPGEEGTAGG